jgi:hypothetical protein
VLAVGLEEFSSPAESGGLVKEETEAEQIFSQEHQPHRPAHVDFEPREYIPPKPKKAVAATLPVTAPAPKPHLSGAARRNETIGRLETWLSQIRKEK